MAIRYNQAIFAQIFDEEITAMSEESYRFFRKAELKRNTRPIRELYEEMKAEQEQRAKDVPIERAQLNLAGGAPVGAIGGGLVAAKLGLGVLGTWVAGPLVGAACVCATVYLGFKALDAMILNRAAKKYYYDKYRVPMQKMADDLRKKNRQTRLFRTLSSNAEQGKEAPVPVAPSAEPGSSSPTAAGKNVKQGPAPGGPI